MSRHQLSTPLAQGCILAHSREVHPLGLAVEQPQSHHRDSFTAAIIVISRRIARLQMRGEQQLHNAAPSLRLAFPPLGEGSRGEQRPGIAANAASSVRLALRVSPQAGKSLCYACPGSIME